MVNADLATPRTSEHMAFVASLDAPGSGKAVAIVSTIVRWKLRIDGAVGGLLEACLVANDLRNVATFSKNAFCRLLSSALLRLDVIPRRGTT